MAVATSGKSGMPWNVYLLLVGNTRTSNKKGRRWERTVSLIAFFRIRPIDRIFEVLSGGMHQSPRR